MTNSDGPGGWGGGQWNGWNVGGGGGDCTVQNFIKSKKNQIHDKVRIMESKKNLNKNFNIFKILSLLPRPRSHGHEC